MLKNISITETQQNFRNAYKKRVYTKKAFEQFSSTHIPDRIKHWRVLGKKLIGSNSVRNASDGWKLVKYLSNLSTCAFYCRIIYHGQSKSQDLSLMMTKECTAKKITGHIMFLSAFRIVIIVIVTFSKRFSCLVPSYQSIMFPLKRVNKHSLLRPYTCPYLSSL